jgi:hypothetical protein
MVMYSRVNVSYKLWSFENFFSNDLPHRILEDSKQFDFYKIEKERTSRPNRIFMNMYDIPSFKECCSILDSKELKQELSTLTDNDFTNHSSRIELCLDSKGSWLEEHVDDPAKHTTMQIYLTDSNISTTFNSKKSSAKFNNGWFFVNTGTEKHSLPPLEHDRISIIVNWVDNLWRDRTVLV